MGTIQFSLKFDRFPRTFSNEKKKRNPDKLSVITVVIYRAYNRMKNQIVSVNRLWDNFDIGYGYITGYQLFYGYN